MLLACAVLRAKRVWGDRHRRPLWGKARISGNNWRDTDVPSHLAKEAALSIRRGNRLQPRSPSADSKTARTARERDSIPTDWPTSGRSAAGSGGPASLGGTSGTGAAASLARHL